MNYKKKVEKLEAQIALIEDERFNISRYSEIQIMKGRVDAYNAGLDLINSLQKESDKLRRKLDIIHWNQTEKSNKAMNAIYVQSQQPAEFEYDREADLRGDYNFIN